MSDLLIEVRCEELPFGMIAPAEEALAQGLLQLIEGVSHGPVSTFSTPRRIAVAIEDVAATRPVIEELVIGPPLSTARRDGQWTKAAIGFARGKALDVDTLEVVESSKGAYVAARVKQGGERTSSLVAAGLDELVCGLPFKKSMRWGESPTRWGRPFHQIVAIHEGRTIEAIVGGIPTSNAVVGHRRSTSGPGLVTDANSYVEAHRQRWVLARRSERQQVMIAALRAKAAELQVEVLLDPELVEEVTDLVEWPVVVAGHFDEPLLELPQRLLIESMKVHQRTFPTQRNGRLHNTFLVVSNNPEGDASVIGAGNVRVLRARFHDASFFFAEDRKLRLEVIGTGLEKMRWVHRLGSMADKQARIALHAPLLAERLGIGAREVAARAGSLAKCDLSSLMVREFPNLQGHMGRLYAETQGEPEAVALAIEEHYLPRFAGDALPSSDAGISLSIADRLDTLCGCFSVGLVPTSSADPQGLRRAANGLLAVLLDRGHRISLSKLVELGGAAFDPRPDVGSLVEFIKVRLRSILLAEGHATDVVDAVLQASGDDAVQLRARVRGLTEHAASKEHAALMVAFKRVLNISKHHGDTRYDRSLFVHDAEHALANAFEGGRSAIPEHVERLEVGEALSAMAALRPFIDTYFDTVLVMDEDAAIRRNRLGFMAAVAKLFLSVADFRLLHSEEP